MKKSLPPLIADRLPEGERAALEALIGLATGQGAPLYLVGGGFRDLLLGRPHLDLDLAVEGDAIELARALTRALAGRVSVHQAFGTASVECPSFRLDLAQTRTETYPQPGDLPLVRPASLAEDLRRRDFTVNAMALRLTPPHAGEVIDPHGGRQDLERRLIRILHAESFRDDATRMLRAVRYEGRLSFRLEEDTERLLRQDLAYLDTISGARLRRELLAIFYEERPLPLLARCRELGILAALHPCLRLDDEAEASLRRAQEERPAPWDEVCLCLLCRSCAAADVGSLVRRLALPKRFQRVLSDGVRLRDLLPLLRQPDLSPSAVVEALEPLGQAAVRALALAADKGAAAERAGCFLREWRYVKPYLSASSLRRLGVAPGPELGGLLRRLRAARLDGVTRGREDELALLGRQTQS